VTATQVLPTAAFPVKVSVIEESCSRLTFAPGSDAATCQPGSRWPQPCAMAMFPGRISSLTSRVTTIGPTREVTLTDAPSIHALHDAQPGSTISARSPVDARERDHVMTSQVHVVIGVGDMGQAIARRQGPGKTVLLDDFNQETSELVA
jgi:hypothetical protein